MLTHPALDWLNTYGIRLLMPFDGRWFYGDVLFIVDPWVWLLLGTAVLLAHSGSRWLVAGWIGLGATATAVVTGVPDAPVALHGLWCLGLALVAGLRVWGGLQLKLPRVATTCLVLVVVYITAMIGSSWLSRNQVVKWARSRGLEPDRIMTAPVPGDPFRRSVLIADDRHYHRLAFNWFTADRVRPQGPETAIGKDHPAAAAARSAPQLRGLLTWSRFPSFTIEPLDDGYRVTVTDSRFGGGVVELDQNLNLR